MMKLIDRKFDIESQRSLEVVQEVITYPAREFLLEYACVQEGIKHIKSDFQEFSCLSKKVVRLKKR